MEAEAVLLHSQAPAPVPVFSQINPITKSQWHEKNYHCNPFGAIWSLRFLKLVYAKCLNVRRMHAAVSQLNKRLWSALFWGVTQRRVVILYWRFGTTYLSHLQGSRSPMKLHWPSLPLKMGPIYCPETSVKDYHSTVCHTAEERRFNQHCGGSLTSRKQASGSQKKSVQCWEWGVWIRVVALCEAAPYVRRPVFWLRLIASVGTRLPALYRKLLPPTLSFTLNLE
jgi:hypothetical protein